jgi:hypothetical protein
LYYPDCFLKHIAEGRRKKEKGRRKKEEGRRKKEEGRKPFDEAERVTRSPREGVIDRIGLGH